jgi:membrane protease YdiL (CAAX protease family)
VARSIPSEWVLNPYLAFLLLVGVALASLRLTHQLRLTLLWLVMLVLVLLYAEAGRIRAEYSLLNLARGALVGTIVALPFFLFARDFFHATAGWLYGVQDLQVLLERAVFLVPLLEEGFFRGVVQRERGLRDGALLFGLMQVLYFVSAANVFPVVIAAVALGMVVLGLLCGYMYQRHGLMGSIGCHVAVNLVLLVLPSVLSSISNLLAF